MNLCFYITGHGYGHAVRCIEVMRTLLNVNPDVRIRIRTSAPQWLFSPLDTQRVQYHYALLDVGALQKNSFSVDKQKTLQTCADLITKKQSLIEKESAFLNDHKINAVISDITPLAFDAAKKSGITALAMGNFSWDWIYNAWLDEYPQYKYAVEDIQSSYQKADGLYRLPFYGDMTVFKNIEDVPLVARKAQMHPKSVRDKLNLPLDKKCILLALRDRDLEVVDWKQAATIDTYLFVSTSQKQRGKNIHSIREGIAPFEEVLNACDAILSKPGYGIVSDSIGNQKPILFIPRQDFAEDAILRRNLKRYAVCEEMSLQQYKKGDWLTKLDKLFTTSQKWPAIDTNGAKQVADKICWL